MGTNLNSPAGSGRYNQMKSGIRMLKEEPTDMRMLKERSSLHLHKIKPLLAKRATSTLHPYGAIQVLRNAWGVGGI